MASPFYLLRKHQKKILVVVGVLCILVFTAGTFIAGYFQRLQSKSAATDEVVVEYRGGELTESDLNALRADHYLAINYLDEVVRRTLENEGQPKAPGFQQYSESMWDPGVPRDSSDEALVREFLLAQKAQELGMTVPDGAIKGTRDNPGFLDLLSDRTMSQRDLAETLRATVGNRINSKQLFEILRPKLLAQNLRRMSRSTIYEPGMETYAGTPAETWEFYKRLNLRVQAELLPISVAAHLAEVEEPTESQVRALFERHKNDFPNPFSPEPGFRQPYRVKYAYVKAELEPFLQAAKETVTEEEIAEYYEEHKERYKIPELPRSEDSPEVSPEDSPLDLENGLAPPAENDGAEKKQGSPGAKEAPAKEESVKKAPVKEEPVKEELPKPTNDDQSHQVNSSDVFFVSVDDPAANSDEDETDPAKKEDDGDTDSAPTSKDPAVKEANPKESDAKESDAKESDAKESDAKESDTKESDVEEPAAKPKPKYRPLESVKDTIREAIAEEKAQKNRNEALNTIQRRIDPYLKKYRKYLANKGTRGERSPPKDIDIEKLAEELNLTYRVTPLVSRQDFMRVDYDNLPEGEEYKELAQAADFNERNFQQVSFLSFELQDNVNLYLSKRLPARTSGQGAPPFLQSFKDSIDPHFLYWRLEDVKAHVPKLEDVRDEVVHAWKMKKALEIAKKKAAELAEKANAQQKPLSRSLEKHQDEIVQSNEFSWMSSGDVAQMGQQGLPRISDVVGAEAAGEDFMRAVFNLDLGEAGVAVNHPETEVYVVRVKSRSPSVTELRENFANEGLTIYTRYLSLLEGQELYNKWYEDLEDEYQVVWKQDREQRRAAF